MLNKVREHCGRLSSPDFDARVAAYEWLCQCNPLNRAYQRFRKPGFSFVALAELLRRAPLRRVDGRGRGARTGNLARPVCLTARFPGTLTKQNKFSGLRLTVRRQRSR